MSIDFDAGTTRPDKNLIFRHLDPHDPRMGEYVCTEEKDYDASQIVIIGCPTGEGVRRGGGREGTDLAPAAVRREFYKLSHFGITSKIFDYGDLTPGASLEETHTKYFKLVSQFLRDGKRVIGLGGGGDISYAGGSAMAEVFGRDNWIAINVDTHLDVRESAQRTNETAFRQLLDENLLRPGYFYEIGYQPYYTSPYYYRFLQNLGVKLVSLDQLRSRETADTEVRELVRQEFIHHSSALSTFFSFDLQVVRSADAPGVTDSNPIGLRGGEFLTLVQFAGKLVNTKLVEFTEINPKYDVDERTAKLVAIAMHRFCSLKPGI